MRHLRWIAFTCFIVALLLTFTPKFAEYHYVWTILQGVGLLCLLLWMRREPASPR